MNERQIIQTIADLTVSEARGLVQGIGDDCAVIRKDDRLVWLLTLDTLIDSVHFDCSWHPPEKLGRKAVSVNVSDIAAMGGRPLFVLLSLGLPKGFDKTWFTDFSRGMAQACEEYGCCVIGGDTVCSPEGINLSLTVIGEADQEAVVYRHGAVVGDTVWVSGQLGYAAAGLALFKKGVPPLPQHQVLLEAHLNPRAQAVLGSKLGTSGLVHAMQDLSDGLATDLAHLCTASRVGATVQNDALPGRAVLTALAASTELDPQELMLSGGEDYQLLFTARPEHSGRLQEIAAHCGQAITAIGTITKERGVRLSTSAASGGRRETPISYAGYDHFRDG